MHNFHFIASVLLLSIILMLVIGAISPLDSPWVHHYSGHLDMTPWKLAKPVGVTLIAIVVGIYASFADISVIGDVDLTGKVVAALFMLAAFFAIYKFSKDAKQTDSHDDIGLDEEEADLV